MDIVDDYAIRNLVVGQTLEVSYKLNKLGDEWRTDPFEYQDKLNILMKSKPTFKCERCMGAITDVHAHMKVHIDEDIKDGLIKDEEDEPSIECPECDGLMEMTDECTVEAMPMKCKCGYKRTIKMYSDGKYLIL